MKNLKIALKVVTSQGFWMFMVMGVIPFAGISYGSFTMPTTPQHSLDALMFGYSTAILSLVMFSVGTWAVWISVKDDIQYQD